MNSNLNKTPKDPNGIMVCKIKACGQETRQQEGEMDHMPGNSEVKLTGDGKVFEDIRALR